MKPTYYINNFDGAVVAVYDNKSASQETLLFLHGNSLSSEIYINQFNSAQLAHLRLIAFDLPGHGKSSSATKPEEVYSFAGLVKSVEHIVEQLQLSSVTVVANSLAGHLVMSSDKSAQYYRGGVFFGYPPVHNLADFQNAVIPSPEFGLFFKAEWTEDEIAALAKTISSEQEIPFDLLSVLRESQPTFRAIYAPSLANAPLRDEYLTISEFKNPIAILHGENERLIKRSYYDQVQLENHYGSFPHIIAGASHIACADQSQAFDNYLLKYHESLMA